MNKTRILEIADGSYMPQFKSGIFSGWKFFHPDADRSSTMMVVYLQEADPAKAARFPTERDARDFVDRFWATVRTHWQEKHASKVREMNGVSVKRVIR